MSNKIRHTRTRVARSESSTHNSQEVAEEASGHRHTRLERILFQELQPILSDECSDPALDGVRVLGVTLSPDGGHARVAYAVTAALDREQEVRRRTEEALVRATGFLRAQLAQLLNLKKLPRLSFTFVGVVDPAAENTGGEP